MAAVAQVTTYQELQSHLTDTLVRTDIDTPVKTLIQMADAKFKRNKDFRKIQDLGTLSISADGTTLPYDYGSVESWYHDGGTFFGPLEIVSADMIGQLKRRVGQTGPPAYAAIIDGKAIYAPAPDATYPTRFIYWRRVDPLSDSNTTNWLLDDHPDIYIYGALVHSAPYLKDDTRLPMWQSLLKEAVEELTNMTEEEQFSGTLRRQYKPIG